MLETCRGGPRPIRLFVEKTKNFDQIQPQRTWRQKLTKILIGPFSPNLKPLEKRTCPTCLKLAGEALGLLGCVLKRLKNFDQIQPLRTWRQKWTKILIGPFSPNLKPLEQRTCPTCLKLAGEALGLLGCVLKRLKILIIFNDRGPGDKNEPKFWSTRFPQI